MRNVSIDIAKVFFAILIVATHLFLLHDPFFHNYCFLAVEFFFFCTGYFLAKHIEKSNGSETTSSFLVKKIKYFIFMLIAAEIISVLVRWIALSANSGSYDISLLIDNAIMSINELLLLQMANIPCYCGIGTGWYFSSMILGLAILYPICTRFKRFMGGTSAVIGIIAIGYIYVCCGTLGRPDALVGGIACGLIRGIADMCIGIFMYTIVKNMSKVDFTKNGKIMLSTIALILIIVSTWFMLSYNCSTQLESNFQFITILAIFVITTILLSEKSYLNISIKTSIEKKIADNLGNISLLIILNNYWVLDTVYAIIPNESAIVKLVWSAVSIIVSMIACYVLSKILKALWNKIKIWSISQTKTD